jgi:LacI family transcriptional regulator
VDAVRPAAPTLYDVAREAGVSLATASRALNGSARRVNEEYRARVLEAAAKLGYTPNLSAQAVARGASSTVSLLVSDIADPYFSAIAAGVMRAAGEVGLSVTMAVTGRDAERELDLVRTMRGQRPRMIVLAGSRSDDDPVREALVAELTSYADGGGRVVLVGQHELPFPTVMLDDRGGASALGHELAGLGYRGFALLAGPERLVTARARVEALTWALGEHGIHPVRVIHGGFGRDAAYAATLDLPLDGIDCVVAVNDVMAIGALSALRERGVALGSNAGDGTATGTAVGVAGFDDIATARDVSPALTTVHLPLESAGAAAVELALAGGTDAEAALPATVVVRASTPRRA